MDHSDILLVSDPNNKDRFKNEEKCSSCMHYVKSEEYCKYYNMYVKPYLCCGTYNHSA